MEVGIYNGIETLIPYSRFAYLLKFSSLHTSNCLVSPDLEKVESNCEIEPKACCLSGRCLIHWRSWSNL
jgi:hypothetical protein